MPKLLPMVAQGLRTVRHMEMGACLSDAQTGAGHGPIEPA